MDYSVLGSTGLGVSTVLVGYSSLEHLEKAVSYAAKGPLPVEILGRLSEVWGRFVPA